MNNFIIIENFQNNFIRCVGSSIEYLADYLLSTFPNKVISLHKGVHST